MLALTPSLFLFVSAILVFVSGYLARDVTAQVVPMAVGAVVSAVGVAAMFAGSHVRWGAVAALIPCLLITQHATTVANRRPTLMAKKVDRPQQKLAGGVHQTVAGEAPALRPAVVRAQNRARAEVSRRATDLFGPTAVGFHYGVPALLSAVVLSLEFGLLRPLPRGRDTPEQLDQRRPVRRRGRVRFRAIELGTAHAPTRPDGTGVGVGGSVACCWASPGRRRRRRVVGRHRYSDGRAHRG